MLDILITPGTSPLGRAMLHTLAHSAGVQPVREPRPRSTLVLYGLGGEDRYSVAMQHVRRGGKLVAWDLGYWDRKGEHSQRKLRVSINGLHSPDYIMRGPVPHRARWDASGFRMARLGNLDGPIVLVGNGPKSNVIGAEGWSAAKSREIRALWPERTIVYRPKPKRPVELGVECDRIDEGPIDALLASASLVVCRHSNVAVDACRLGIPVVCDDGAAAAIYPQRLEDKDRQPGSALRREFLVRLAWWQWSEMEARQGKVWPWLNEVLARAN